jgi:hypothetical protein
LEKQWLRWAICRTPGIEDHRTTQYLLEDFDMRFIQSFNYFRSKVWMGLLIAILLVSGPLHAVVPIATGKITAVDVIERVVAIDGARYRLVPQAEIYRETDQGFQITSMTDLRIGQVVAYEVSGELILNIRILSVHVPE